MKDHASINTALLVALIVLQLGKEPPRTVAATPVLIAPAVAQTAVADVPVAVAPVKPAEKTAEAQKKTFGTMRVYRRAVGDSVEYYADKEMRLRMALMKDY